MEFKQFFEMASFTLPEKIKIGKEYVTAIDMQFEKNPPTFNNDGRVMNQGSKFIAKIPNSAHYLTYDGQGESSFVRKKEALYMLEKGYQKIPSNWWKKANLI